MLLRQRRSFYRLKEVYKVFVIRHIILFLYVFSRLFDLTFNSGIRKNG